MRVFIASPLHSYTGGRSEVECAGATVAEVLAELDRRYPGLRFRVVDEQDRIREHMRIYVGTEAAPGLDQPILAGQEVHILQALSGGGTLPMCGRREVPPAGPPQWEPAAKCWIVRPDPDPPRCAARKRDVSLPIHGA